MHSVALVLAPGFEEVEAMAPFAILQRASIPVTLYSLNAGRVRSSKGAEIVVNRTIEEASIKDEHDVLVLPGGPGAKELASSKCILDLALHFLESPNWLAAICASPGLVLGPILDSSRTITCFPGSEEAVSNARVDQSQEVIVDGNLITARASGSAILFALKLVEILIDRKTRGEIVSNQLLYKDPA